MIVKLGEYGQKFRVRVKQEDGSDQDISTATSPKINFRKGDDTKVAKTATIVTVNTIDYIQYITISGDVDVVGKWFIEGEYVKGGGLYKTESGCFQVKDV